MEKRKVTSEAFFRTLLILFAGMLMSQFTFAGVMVYMQLTGELELTAGGLEPMWTYILIGGASIGLLTSPLLANMFIAKAAMKPTLSEKLRGYQTASIIRYALLELPSILGIVGFMNTGAYWFFGFTGASVISFLLVIPNKQRAIEALRLNHEEAALVNDPAAVLMEYETSTSD
jgi:hypothetical protein